MRLAFTMIDAARSYAEALAGSVGNPMDPTPEAASITLHRQLCGLGA